MTAEHDFYAEQRDKQFELPRTCKKCKVEKPASEFRGKETYTSWCKQCRMARWEFLKAQRKPKKENSPTIKDLISAASGAAYCAFGPCESCKADEDKLQKLQEEYTWTAVKKR